MKRLRQGIVGSLVLAVCVLMTIRASATQGEERARVLFKEGVGHLQQGEFEPALERFQSAYEHWRNPKILLNIATTLRQLGRLPEAGDAYELYLADPGADAGKTDEVEQVLAEIDAKLGRLTIEVDVDDATVRINGALLERSKTPATKNLVRTLPSVEDEPGRWRVRLDPGEHTIEIAKDGYQPIARDVEVGPGESKSLEFSLNVLEEVAEPAAPTVPDEASSGSTASLSHNGQFAVFTRADIDGKFRGAVGALGVGYGLGSFVEPQIAALVGRDKGVEPGASFYLSEGMFKPLGYVGVPVFFVDGASPGIHGAVGLQVDPAQNFGGFLQLGVATFFNVPEQRESTAFVPSVGIQGRL